MRIKKHTLAHEARSFQATTNAITGFGSFLCNLVAPCDINHRSKQSYTKTVPATSTMFVSFEQFP